ncbi:MAG: DNA internalization-related competence protein ComEC/Rec2 [Pseudomonadota bacterium]
MLKYSLVFLAGNVLLQQFSQLNSPLFFQLIYFLLALLLLLFILGHFIQSCHYKKWLNTSLFLLLFFASSFFISYFNAKQSLAHIFPEQLQSKEILVRGYIDSIPIESPLSIKFNFRIEQILEPKTAFNKQRVRLSWYKSSTIPVLLASDIKPGDFWQFKLKLKQPSGLLNPGGRDYEKWLFAHKIRAVGYIRKAKENKLLDNVIKPILPVSQQLLYRLHQLRQKMATQLKFILKDNEFKGIYLALILGIKDQITPLQWQVFLDSGTNHLIAISGLHIGLLAAIGFYIGLVLWSVSEVLLKRFPAQLAGAVMALIFAFVYAALAGFSIPTQRALIMISLALSAFFFRLYAPPGLILSYTLIGVLLIDPMASMSIGFWLSFAAVAIILSSVSKTTEDKKLSGSNFEAIRFTDKLKAKLITGLKFFAQLSRLQIIIFIGLLPFSLLFFSRLLLLSPIANLVAVPLMSLVIVPVVLLAALIGLFYTPLTEFLFEIISYLMQFLWWFLEQLIAIDINIIHLQLSNMVVIIFIFLAVILFFIFKQSKKRWLIILLLIALLFLKDLLPQQYSPQWIDSFGDKPLSGEFNIYILDVGQGLSVVIQTQQHVLLYDTGNALSRNFDMAKLVVQPFLNYHSIAQIDKLVLSHGDHDHVAAAPAILEKIPVRSILTGEPKRLEKKFSISAEQCNYGQQWVWDGVCFEVLSPQTSLITGTQKSNNHSCVILISSANGQKLLLTGDIEKKIEAQLLDLTALADINILIAPHHGSKSSSSQGFVSRLKPKIVVFTNGYLNRYNFPATQVIERYKQQGSRLFSTQNGRIKIKTGVVEGEILVSEYRKENRHYWNRKYQQIE